jgi:hypothetical protein
MPAITILVITAVISLAAGVITFAVCRALVMRWRNRS